MKKIIISLLLLITSVVMFSQQSNPASVLTKQDYLQKSKNQKTAAWILLGGGTAVMITGIIVYNNDVTNEQDPVGAFVKSYTSTGLIITAIGSLAAAGSIPLFIASGKSKRKAMSLSFKMQQVPLWQKGSLVNQPIPSVNFKIGL